MAQLATCPECTSQFALPENTTMGDRAECPHCQATFLLSEIVQYTIPTAKILPPESESVPTSGKYISGAQEAVPTGSTDTLASWEARLKKAIDADVEEMQSETEKAFSDDVMSGAGALPDSLEADSNMAQDDPDQPPHSPAAEATHDLESISKSAGSEPRPRRQKRRLVPLVFSVCLGVIGIPLGLYALLWLKGPAGDHLRIAQYLPDRMLPASLRHNDYVTDEQSEGDSPVQEDTRSPPNDETEIAESAPNSSQKVEVMRDEQVSQVTAEMESNVRSYPRVSNEEFRQALANAEEALPKLLAGELTTQSEIARKGQAYMSLCRLAEKFQYVHEVELATPGASLAASANQLFRDLFTNENLQHELSQIAARWWEYDGRPSQGIIFLGKLQRVKPLEEGQLGFFSLAGAAQNAPIPVFLSGSNYQPNSMWGIVGMVLANPEEYLGEDGRELDQAVLAHEIFEVEDSP